MIASSYKYISYLIWILENIVNISSCAVGTTGFVSKFKELHNKLYKILSQIMHITREPT